MDFAAYQLVFQRILFNSEVMPPYDQPDYMNYTRLNWSRQQRWLKTGILDPVLVNTVENIGQGQFWTVITEPWCGDAAHSLPFIHKLSELNPLIKIDYRLRVTPPLLIDEYLTNGAKSIPKLIIRNEAGGDLATWGPRPASCQQLYNQLLKDHADPKQKKNSATTMVQCRQRREPAKGAHYIVSKHK